MELYAQNGMSRPSGVTSSTQHFISWRTLRVYGSRKSWTTIMKTFSVIVESASGRLTPHASAQSSASSAGDRTSSRSSEGSVPTNADALHGRSSASRVEGSGTTPLVTSSRWSSTSSSRGIGTSPKSGSSALPWVSR